MSAKIALFIPCYNEEKRLKPEKLKKFIIENRNLIEFFFVDDGSLDQTSHIIKTNLLDFPNTNLLQLNENYGKGNALRQAMLEIDSQKYEYSGFIDADLDIPLNQITRLYNTLNQDRSKIMAISYRDFYRRYHYLNLRSLASIVMVFLANRLLDFDQSLKDTQCGCKLFRTKNLPVFFGEKFISEWLFDIEILFRLKKNIKFTRSMVCEVPVLYMEKSENSKVKPIHGLRILKQLYAIYSYYK